MTESEELKSLKYVAENEKGKAQSKIYELRNKIAEIEKEISHYEGEKEMAEYIISKIDDVGNKNMKEK